MTQKLNSNAPILFMHGEETAGVVGDLLRREILDALSIAYVSEDVSVANRILTKGSAVMDATNAVVSSKGATLVKEPGITPRPDQLLDAVVKLETEGKLTFDDAELSQKVQKLRDECQPASSDEGMARFAYAIVGAKKPVTYKGVEFDNGSGLINADGSPNAIWRKVLGATLLRGVSAMLQENSTASMPKWSSATPISVIAREKSDANTQIARVPAGDYRIVFEPASGSGVQDIGKMNIEGDDTPVRLYSDSKADFTAWFKAALEKIGDAELVHAMKQTVITTDYAYIEWMDGMLAEQGKAGQIAGLAKHSSDAGKLSTTLLADNVIGALTVNPPSSETFVISPNASYAGYVEMLQGIREAGGFKIPVNSEVIRAAATKDHYARVELRAEEAGIIKIVDASGNAVLERSMAADDIAMATNLDRARIATLVTQTLSHALASGKTNVLFGFDAADPYYGIAVEELDKQAGDAKYASLNITRGSDKEMTVKYFTEGAEDCLLTLGNIHGDYATDIELAGKGTSYSMALLADGRMAIETGSLGTAPDILHDATKNFGWKRDGMLIYNPMAFVEAYAYALEGVALNMGGDALVQKTAKALEAAIYSTTQKGYVLPVSQGTLRQASGVSETKVSTHTFVQHILLEALFALKGEHPAATADNIANVQRQFEQGLAMDTAIFEILSEGDDRSQQWKDLNWEINAALIHAGEIDPDAPDYSIRLPEGTDYANLTAGKLFELRMAQKASAVAA